MLLAFYVVSGLAACLLVAATFASTADAYADLPDKVPLHIGPDGYVDGRGPRAFIWVLPLVQLLTALLLAAVVVALGLHLPNSHGSPKGACVTAVCVLAMFWRVQGLLLQVARNDGGRVDLSRFWIWILLVPAGVIAAILLG